jgi:Stealth protein CR2, conserved region 2/Stealth protein CR1, conserved region 1/Stealth protein CR3, conserved region 3
VGVFRKLTGSVVAGQERSRNGVRQVYRVARALDRSGGVQEVNAGVAREIVAARRRFVLREDLVRDGQRWCLPLGDKMPRDVTMANFEIVDTALKAAGIQAFSVRGLISTKEVVAVDAKQREAVLQALADTWRDEPVLIQAVLKGERSRRLELPVAAAALSPGVAGAGVVRVWRYYRSATGTLLLGPNFACEIEFWSTDKKTGVVRAPRPNVAADILTTAETELVDSSVGDRPYPTAKVFTRRMLEDITFPIDAVYTWVDGEDPVWREKMLRARAEADGREYHPLAHGDHRFVQRDELKFSLRSLAMYAPWIRHIYLVTDNQCPDWLDRRHPKITLVDHKDIFDDHSVLPVFNSNAIISRLHHIPGLGEHYIFFNDDFFLGRPLTPGQFFTPQGMALVSPSRNRRPFGAAAASDEPHFNLSRNIRALIEQEFGVTISHAIKHTPYPQLRSVHEEMEAKFADVYRKTVSSRFRHHEDIVADQLFHYYAQAIGKAVPSQLRYDYVNIGVAAEMPRLRRLLNSRDKDVFCLNDAPELGDSAPPEGEVRAILEDYYPVPCEFEKR